MECNLKLLEIKAITLNKFLKLKDIVIENVFLGKIFLFFLFLNIASIISYDSHY